MNWIVPIASLIAVLSAGYLRYKDRIKLGFSFDKWALTEAGLGLVIAFIPVSIAFYIIWATGYLEITDAEFRIMAILISLRELSFYALIEELLFRVGILLILIYTTKKVWLAIAIEILLFGLGHMFNPGASALTVFSNSLGGLMYSLAFIYTGRIWMPVILHLFWNFSQGFYGFNISGIDDYSEVYLSIEPIGNDLISGGSYGLEGSLIGISARIMVMALIVYSSKKMSEMNSTYEKQKESILPESIRTSMFTESLDGSNA